MAEYWVRWDPTNKNWEFSVDGGAFADLVERPTFEGVKLVEASDPAGGSGRIWFTSGLLALGPNVFSIGNVYASGDPYVYFGLSSTNAVYSFDNNDYMYYDRTNNFLAGVIGGAGTELLPIRFERGGTIVNPNGITAGINVITWIAPYACTVTAVKGYRVGGTGATINARKNGSSNHLSSDLSLTSADTWMDAGSVQNATYAAGDKLEIMVVSVAGSPTQVGVQINFKRP